VPSAVYRGTTPSAGGGVPSELSSAHTDSSAASSGGVSGASLIRQVTICVQCAKLSCCKRLQLFKIAGAVSLTATYARL
jgi:hypothetical protein